MPPLQTGVLFGSAGQMFPQPPQLAVDEELTQTPSHMIWPEGQMTAHTPSEVQVCPVGHVPQEIDPPQPSE